MKPSSLDDHVIEAFMLINSRKRCEFLANFPLKGTTLKNIAEDGIFGANKSTVCYYLNQYKSYIHKDKKQDKKHRKILNLNSDGRYLQKAAGYMAAIASEMITRFDGKINYLELFIPRSDPKEMIRIMYEIFENNIECQPKLYRNKRDKNTRKLLSRLSRFGLIELKKGKGTSPSIIHQTEIGVYYYKRLLSPLLGYLAGDLQGGDTVKISNGAMFEAYQAAIKSKS